MVRYWASLHDEKHPVVFDSDTKDTYCISCSYYRSTTVTLKDFKEWNGNVEQVTLTTLAEFIKQFKHKPEFRKDKIKEIAKYLLINTDSV